MYSPFRGGRTFQRDMPMTAKVHTTQPIQDLEERGPLVWLGPPFFSSQLPPLGWELIQSPHEIGRIRAWEDIISLTGGRTPAAVVVADASLPPHVIGVENYPCPTVFYAVDSHIHSWYPHYAQAFDVCLVSLRDHIPLFIEGRLPPERVWWSPAYARTVDRPPTPEKMPAKEWPLLFVGTVDQERSPERFAFMRELREKVPGLHLTTGYFGTLYPKAELVLNEASKGDLNFRVFEALGCGACLLTPHVGHGLDELFSDGRDLFFYPPGDAAAVAELATRLLEAPDLCRAVAKSGLMRVDAAHRSSHRARSFSERLLTLLRERGKPMLDERLGSAQAIHKRYLKLMYLLHADTTDLPAMRQAYLDAARSITD